MKIAIFTDTYFPQINGVTYTLQLWKRELERIGHEVTIYYPKSKEYKPKPGESPLRSVSFPFYEGYRIGFPSAGRIKRDMDVIHVQSPATVGLLGYVTARRLHKPLVMTYHTPPDYYTREILPFGTRVVHEAMRSSYYVYEKKLLQKCDALTTPSREIAEILRSRMGDQLEILVLPNGIDTDFFSETRGNMREELGIPEGRIIGFAGRHTEAKRVEDLIKLADYFDGTVVIAGEGPMTKKYKELARGKANVKFLGFLERGRLPEFYSMLDLLILPSVAETEGLVVIEANACRTPVIGANAMALRSTIVDGKTGYLYEPSNIEDMIEKVKMGYKNIEKLRRGARKHALGRSVKNTARRLSSIYEDIANKHRGRE